MSEFTRIEMGDWFEKYKPIENPNGGSGPAFGDKIQMFETYGADFKKVQDTDPKKLWTLLDCDGHLIISPGFHIVNRLGYYITEVEWEHEDIEVFDGDEIECEKCHDVHFCAEDHVCDPEMLDG
jgi:hypothetical protein